MSCKAIRGWFSALLAGWLWQAEVVYVSTLILAVGSLPRRDQELVVNPLVSGPTLQRTSKLEAWRGLEVGEERAGEVVNGASFSSFPISIWM